MWIKFPVEQDSMQELNANLIFGTWFSPALSEEKKIQEKNKMHHCY